MTIDITNASSEMSKCTTKSQNRARVNYAYHAFLPFILAIIMGLKWFDIYKNFNIFYIARPKPEIELMLLDSQSEVGILIFLFTIFTIYTNSTNCPLAQKFLMFMISIL